MRAELHRAHILHQRPYRETSRILELFSSCHGRIGVLAKGAMRPRSPLRGVLQPFCPLVVAFSGRGELPTLIAAEADGPVLILSGRRLVSALYLNEILIRIVPRQDPHPLLYDAYRGALAGLRQAPDEEPVLRIFEKRMLQEVGYGLNLDHDVECRAPLAPDRDYYYQCDKGPWRAAPAEAPTVRVKGRTLIALEREVLDDPETLRESKQLMRRVIAAHLGDRPLQSRQLLREQLRATAVNSIA